MVQSPSWGANWYAASQEIPRISRNPNVHYRTHKRPPPVPILAKPIQSIYPHPSAWRSILILPTQLRLGLPSGLFPSDFPSKTLLRNIFKLLLVSNFFKTSYVQLHIIIIYDQFTAPGYTYILRQRKFIYIYNLVLLFSKQHQNSVKYFSNFINPLNAK